MAEVITRKKASALMLTQRNQPRTKAKISMFLTTAHHTNMSTKIPNAIVICKSKIGISQPKLQSGSSHNAKRLASRSAGQLFAKIITTSRPNTNGMLSTEARVQRIYSILLAMIIYICQSGVIAFESVARTAGEAEVHNVISNSNHRAMRAAAQYSQLLSTDGQWADDTDNDSFRPIIPKGISPEYIAQNVFTKTGQYRVFEPPASDLRITVPMEGQAKSIKYLGANDKVPMAPSNANNSASAIKQTTNVTTKTLTFARPETETTAMQKIAKRKGVAEALAGRNSEETLDKTKNLSERIENVAIMPKIVKLKEESSMVAHKIKSLPNTLDFDQPAEQQRKLEKNSKQSATPQATFADASENIVSDDMKDLEALLLEYAESFFNKAHYKPSNELVVALQKNHTSPDDLPLTVGAHKNRPARHASANPHHPHHHHHHLQHHHHLNPLSGIARKADGDLGANIPRAIESGRLLFFTGAAGLKKVLWPVFMGLQVLKSLLFALFLPTLIGSFSKLIGKGIVSGSAPLFIRPPDAPQDLDFRDNTINFDDDKFAVVDEGTKDDGYAYHQAEASQTHYTYNAADINRIEQQNKMPDTYLSALQTIGAASFKNSGSLSGSSFGGGAPMRTKPIAPANTNTFQTFQKVPASSLLLSNYDPFYSPLLSRLDSVFAQLKLSSDNENCREKLICLMYANPAKYAPYSNLVSAQLSRELNELRKPTTDNSDILRFFKYMRAAKDGQDGVDCEKSFDRCKEFKDFENPAMVSTYHDINKLVQARKLT